MQEAEPGAVGGEQQMIKPVAGARPVTALVRNFGGLRERNDQTVFAGFETQPPDARILGDLDLGVGIGDAGVAVAGTPIVQAAEVGSERPFAVGAERNPVWPCTLVPFARLLKSL
jgi:hypothetical protein